MVYRQQSYVNSTHAAMTDFLGAFCPGESAKVSVYSSRGVGDIVRWGAKHMCFVWDFPSFEHVAQILQSDHEYEITILVSYGKEPSLQYKRKNSKGWVTCALPRELR